MKSLKTSLILVVLSLLASCNQGGSSSGSGNNGSGGAVMNQNEEIAPDGSNVNGFYAGDMIPLNYNLHFRKVGMAGVSREGDNFQAYVRLKNGAKSMVHKQAIYTGRRCPNLNDDLNKDAYIDMQEAKIAIGKITIPLDADLDSQDGGMNQYPSSDEMGKMFYQRSASFERMFADLKGIDTNSEDNIIKLEPDDGITFPGRVVIIQGIPESVLLPSTIAVDEPGEKPHKNLPMGCVVLWKVPEMPAELMSDQPLPTGNGGTVTP